MENINSIENFALTLSYDDIPVDVLEKTKLLFLDSLSTIIKGNQSAELSNLINSVTNSQQSEKNSATGLVLGERKALDYRMSALINGVGMVADELDEGNPLAKGHPAAHFLPALLSLSFEHKVPGKKTLEAFIVNYEISARLGSVIKLKESIHPHGNWGVFGNGFGIGKLLNWKDANDYKQAAMLGISFSMPTLWHSVLEGHKVRNIIIGLNNYHTTLLSDLVESGFTASSSTLDILYKEIFTDGYNDYPEDLFDTFYLMKSYFKFYPYCRFCHSSVDAVMDLVKQSELMKIKEINIKTYSVAAKLNAKRVENEFAGKFSIPYAIAAQLSEVYHVEKNFNLTKNELIQRLMSLVTVSESKAYTALLPDKRRTTVEIELINGTVKEKTVERATGDPDEPLLKEKVIDKSKTILGSRFESDRVNEIIDTVLHLEKLEDMRELKKLFS